MTIEWNKITWYSKLGAIILFIFVVPVLTFYIGMQYEQTKEVLSGYAAISISSQKIFRADYKNVAYIVNEQPVTLVNGRAEEPIAGSASKIVTQYFGNESFGDLNGDGLPDVAFVLTENQGGSGTFFYAAVALKTATGYRGLNAIGLGDRIAPQTTEIRNGQLIVNYADRKTNEPMSSQPTEGRSKYLVVKNGVLEEVK